MKVPLMRLSAAAVPAAPAARAAPEMCADYSGRRPNCNAARAAKRPQCRWLFRRFAPCGAQAGPLRRAANRTRSDGQIEARRSRDRPRPLPADDRTRYADADRRRARAAGAAAARRARFRRRRRLRLAAAGPPARCRCRSVNRVEMSLLKGIDRVRDMLVENTERFAQGLPANNALLWGARGMGKSSLVKAVACGGQRAASQRPAASSCRNPPRGHREPARADGAAARRRRYRFIVFCDDLSFDADDTSYKSLKAVLEGGIEGRPENVIFYATSNRRHLMPRDMMENERSTAINPGEAVEEKVSLSDRFGLWLGFHRCSQDEYPRHGRGLRRPFPHSDAGRRRCAPRRWNGRPRAARAPAAWRGNTCRIWRDGSA